MKIHSGPDATSPLMLKFERPFRCTLAPCKCCCQQEIWAKDPATGAVLGGGKEGCWMCAAPFFHILDASMTPQYEIQQPTCCCGICVNFCAEGCCNCKVPFYIFPPGKRDSGADVGKVIKEWGGLASEIFTSADKFSVTFPPDSTPEMKAAIWAAVMLIDYNFFEGGKEAAIGAPPTPEAPEIQLIDRG